MVAEIDGMCRGIRASVLHGAVPVVAVDRILAITGSEEEPDRRLRPGDQPLPVPADGPSMHDLVADDICRCHPGGAAPWISATVRDLAARKQLGLDRYGSLLQAGNGRDALRGLHEEMLDALVYCRQWLEERGEAERFAAGVRQVYRRLLDGVLAVRRVMDGSGEETRDG